MAQSDYYEMLGVSPSASASEIRTAHRELVKKYHPDLFTREADKARATDKLRQINEAYAVLGNAERRREHDEARSRKATTFKRASTETRSTSTRRSKRARKKGFNWRKYAGSRKAAGCILGAILVAWWAYAANREPQVATVWMLLENTVVEPPHSFSGPNAAGPKWTAAGQYPFRSQCREGLKARVNKDEQEGSKAILDERGGTVALTVYIKDGAKRVRNYECRETRVVEPDSWFRRILRRVGLAS
ncbi:MAG: J domain-containing protein [Candidatus Binatia bacterium]